MRTLRLILNAHTVSKRMLPDFRRDAADNHSMGKKFILTTTKRGTVRLPEEVFDHLGLPHGGFLKVTPLPGSVCRFTPIHIESNAVGRDNRTPIPAKPGPAKKTRAIASERKNTRRR